MPWELSFGAAIIIVRASAILDQLCRETESDAVSEAFQVAFDLTKQAAHKALSKGIKGRKNDCKPIIFSPNIAVFSNPFHIRNAIQKILNAVAFPSNPIQVLC